MAWIAGGLAITAAFCVIYLSVLLYADDRPRLAEYGLAAIAILAALACVVSAIFAFIGQLSRAHRIVSMRCRFCPS